MPGKRVYGKTVSRVRLIQHGGAELEHASKASMPEGRGTRGKRTESIPPEINVENKVKL